MSEYDVSSEDGYSPCNVCGELEWRKVLSLDMCPRCILNLLSFRLEISFSHSKSKKFKKAVKMVEKFSTYEFNAPHHFLRFYTLGDYAINSREVDKLLMIIFGWVSFKANINDIPVTSYNICCIADALKRLAYHNKGKGVHWFNDTSFWVV